MLEEFVFDLKKNFLTNCDTELRAQINRNRRVSMLRGNVVGNARTQSSGVCARVRKGGVSGFSSMGDVSPEAARTVLAAAADNAVFLDSRLARGKAPYAPISNGLKRVADGAVDSEQKYYIEYMRRLDAYIEQKYPDLASRQLSLTDEYIEKVLAVSSGVDSHNELKRSYIYITMSKDTPRGDGVECTEILGGWGEFGSRFVRPEDDFAKIDELYLTTVRKSEGVYADAGLKMCVLDGSLAGMLAHEAVGHTVEADIVLGGSVAASKLGKQVASELVTMVDYAHTSPDGVVPLPVYVDDEGVEARDAVLIKDGILVGYMNNRETAERFGMQPCGNARAFAYSDEPLIRMRNTAVCAGTSKIEDIIASVDDGYYLCKTNNGQADTTGEFMFGITMGYEIKKGKIGRAILDTTISGLAFDMLKTVDMVSDTVEWCSSGYCGKKQMIPVSLGGPALRCFVNVGGR